MHKDHTTACRALRLRAVIATALVSFIPSTAYATSGGDSTGLLGQIAGFFSSLQGIGLAIYYGMLLIAGALCFCVIGKELIPAFMRSNQQDRPQFKQHVTAAVVAAAVLVALGLAPILVPAAYSYFGAAADVGLSAVSGGSGM